MLSKKDLENLAALARLRIDAKNEKKLIQDLEKILGHFNELKNVDTQNVEPMTGGTAFTNIFREDDAIGGGLDKTSLGSGAISGKKGRFFENPAGFFRQRRIRLGRRIIWLICTISPSKVFTPGF